MAKRDDLVRGALAIFARDGYTKARIVDIAKESNVSTRTIYNLFTDKPGLFAAVVEHVADEFVGARLRTIEECFAAEGSLATVLIGFAARWLHQSAELAVYLQFASRIQIDRQEIPQVILDRGMEIGPARVQAAIALRLKDFMHEGKLRQGDPHVMGLHLLQLIEGVPEIRGYYSATKLSADDLGEIARESIMAFLHGHADPGTV